VTIVNDDSVSDLKLIDDPSVVIYDHHRFIIQATDFIVIKLCKFVIYKLFILIWSVCSWQA
jgi:hypothetical protein